MKIKMKKVLCALFAIILVCAGLSACEKSPCYAKITYSDGSSEMLDKKDMEELFSLSAENAYAFKEKYEGSEIEAVASIFDISLLEHGASIRTSNWSFYLSFDEYKSLIPDLRKGTLVKFHGELYTGGRDPGELGYFYLDDVDTFEIIEEE